LKTQLSRTVRVVAILHRFLSSDTLEQIGIAEALIDRFQM
jgi:hypothetical protein